MAIWPSARLTVGISMYRQLSSGFSGNGTRLDWVGNSFHFAPT